MQSCCASDSFNYKWTNGNIRDEMPVHDVQMEALGAGLFDNPNTIFQPGEISRK